MVSLVMGDQHDFNGFAIRKLAGVQNAQLFGVFSHSIRPDRNDLAGRAGGGQRPIEQEGIFDTALDIQHARNHCAIRRGEQFHLGRSDIHIEAVFPGCVSPIPSVRRMAIVCSPSASGVMQSPCCRFVQPQRAQIRHRQWYNPSAPHSTALRDFKGNIALSAGRSKRSSHDPVEMQIPD